MTDLTRVDIGPATDHRFLRGVVSTGTPLLALFGETRVHFPAHFGRFYLHVVDGDTFARLREIAQNFEFR